MISLYFCILQNASVLEPYFDLYVTLTFSAYIAIKCIYFVFFFFSVYLNENWAQFLRKLQIFVSGFILSIVQ